MRTLGYCLHYLLLLLIHTYLCLFASHRKDEVDSGGGCFKYLVICAHKFTPFASYNKGKGDIFLLIVRLLLWKQGKRVKS